MEPSQHQRDFELNHLRLKKEKWERDQPQGRIGIVQVLNPDETMDLLYLYDAQAGQDIDEQGLGDTMRDAVAMREMVLRNPKTLVPYEDGRRLMDWLIHSVAGMVTEKLYGSDSDEYKARVFLDQFPSFESGAALASTIFEVRMGEPVVTNHHANRVSRGNITITYRHHHTQKISHVRLLGEINQVLCDELYRLYVVFLHNNPQTNIPVQSQDQIVFTIPSREFGKKAAVQVAKQHPAKHEAMMQITRREYKHLVKEVGRLQSRLNTTQKTLEDVVRRLDQLTGDPS